MAIAVYHRPTNQVRTMIRDDHDGYVPPDGWELVPVEDLPVGWTPEPPPPMDRETVLSQLAVVYAEQQEQGVTLASGLRLRSTEHAHNDYQQLTTFALLALTTGQAPSLAWWDADGVMHQSTPAEWAAIAAEYAQLCAMQRYAYEALVTEVSK